MGTNDALSRRIRFIFASRELPEYGGSTFNDDFEMLVSFFPDVGEYGPCVQQPLACHLHAAGAHLSHPTDPTAVGAAMRERSAV